MSRAYKNRKKQLARSKKISFLLAPASAKVGCGKIVGPPSYPVDCGWTDMGQTLPILCDECIETLSEKYDMGVYK